LRLLFSCLIDRYTNVMDLMQISKDFRIMLFHQYLHIIEDEFPIRYQNLISPTAKVYVTGLRGRDMLDYLRDKSEDDEVIYNRCQIAQNVSEVISGHKRDIFF